MEISSLVYVAVFFFILGAGIIGLIWVLIALFRSVLHKESERSSQDPNLSVLARLLRNLTNQELVVEIDGKTYRSASELSAAQQRRLGIISSVLVKWLQPSPAASTTLTPEQLQPSETLLPDDQPASAESSPAEPLPETALTPLPEEQTDAADSVDFTFEVPPPPAELGQPVNDWVPATAFTVTALDHQTPPFIAEPEPEVKPVSTRISDVVSGIFNPAPAPAPAFKSIAMQINDILQEKIAETQFDSRGIAVSDGPDHGVLVTLDGKKYSGVKDVPDEEVRSLIRSAVMDWEKSNKATKK